MGKLIKPDLGHEHWLVANADADEIHAELELLRVPDQSKDPDVEAGAVLVDYDEYYENLIVMRNIYRKPYKMTVQLKGDWESKKVWLFEELLDPKESLNYRNHSPDGFAWGYGGSGPSQLALAISIKLFGLHRAMDVYQTIKFQHISKLPQEDFEVDLRVELPVPKGAVRDSVYK